MNVPPKVGFIALGCPKATVDSERILTQLRAEGYDITASYTDAQLVIVNTCGFINEAVEESLETVAEALNQNGHVIVTGCLGRHAEMISSRYPQVLAITGPDALNEVMTAVHHSLPAQHEPYLDLIPPGGIKLTPRHYAYLKIAEGCHQQCSFCIIPSLRGPLVSRPIGEIMTEAQALVDAGVTELLLIAQDTAAYGLDSGYRLDFWQGRPLKTRITELVRTLAELEVWLRLHYVYPYPHVDQLVALMAEGLVLPYLDVPLQHGSAQILKAMRRPAKSEQMLNRIAAWRAQCPQIALRSTFIVGFPGETDEDFEQLLIFIQAAQFDRVGAFPYSPVNGAAANALADPVPDAVKTERLQELMAIQSAISATRLQQRLQQTYTVVIDELNSGLIYARSYAEAPEIDGLIIIPTPENHQLEVGDFIEVVITHSDEHDLYAQIIAK